MTISSHVVKKSSEHQHQSERISREPSHQPGPDGPYADILALQHGAGNQAVSALLQPRNDNHASTGDGVTPVVDAVVNSGGQPLDPKTRVFMESRFDHDFSGVRIHMDAQAAESACGVNALAYTVGRDVVFGTGRYSPNTSTGLQLLAHELAHVVQQEKGGAFPPSVLPGNMLDQAADQAASAITNGSQAINVAGTSAPGLARQPLSLTQTLNPGALADQELERETLLVRQWLSGRGNVSGPDTEQMVQALNGLEAEVNRRRAKPPAQAAKNPILPRVTGDDKQDLMNVMAIIDSIKPSETASGLYTTTIEGRTVDITPEQVEELRGQAKKAIRDSLTKIKNKAEDAGSRYQAQSDVDKQHWIVAPIVKTLGRVKDPGPFLIAQVSIAKAQAAATEAALTANKFASAANSLAEAEEAAVKAQKMWEAYFEQIIGSAEMTVTVLEYTRDASFITLGVLAVIATGGAAAGAAGATTTVAGIEVGTATAANVVATGAPIVATLGTAGVQAALGDKVDWGKVAIDVAVSLILSKFGGKLSNGIFNAVAGNAAVQNIGRMAFGRIVSSVLAGSASRVFTTSVDAVYRSFKGQDVTWDQFTDELIKRLTDPKAAVIDAVMGAVTAGAQVKYGGRPSSPVKSEEKQLPALPPPRLTAGTTATAPQAKETRVIPITQAQRRVGPPTKLRPGEREVTSLEARLQQAGPAQKGRLLVPKAQAGPKPEVMKQEQPAEIKLAAGAERVTPEPLVAPTVPRGEPTVASAGGSQGSSRAVGTPPSITGTGGSSGGRLGGRKQLPPTSVRSEVEELFSEAQGIVGEKARVRSQGMKTRSGTAERPTLVLSHPDALRASLEEAGIPVPPGHDPHHIVPSAGGGKAGDRARAVLERESINPDTEPNGVPLPRTTLEAPETIPEGLTRHQTIHTKRYYETLADMLEAAPPGTVRDLLRKIRLAIQQGQFPH